MITDYEVFENECANDIYGLTDECKNLIYECYCVYLNPKWVRKCIDNNEYIEIYERLIPLLAKNKDKCEDGKNVCVYRSWLEEAKKDLFIICNDIIKTYCINY